MAYISSCNEGRVRSRTGPLSRPTPLPPSNGTMISSVGQIFMAGERVQL